MQLAAGNAVRAHVQLQRISNPGWYRSRSTVATSPTPCHQQTLQHQQATAAPAFKARVFSCSCCHASQLASTTAGTFVTSGRTAAAHDGTAQHLQQATSGSKQRGCCKWRLHIVLCQSLPADANDSSSCITTSSSNSNSSSTSNDSGPSAASTAALAAAEAIAAAAEAEQAALLSELDAAATVPQVSAMKQERSGEPTQQQPVHMKLQPAPAPVPAAVRAAVPEATVSGGGVDEDMEATWQAAVEAVSSQLGQPAADLNQQLQLLRLLLPDLDATLAARSAAAQQWMAVAEALHSGAALAGAGGGYGAASGYAPAAAAASGAIDWGMLEVAIMDQVQEAIRCCERDGSDAFLHNRLMMGIAEFFSALRYYDLRDPCVLQQQQLLLQQLQHCASLQRQKVAQMMQQQVAMAASCIQLPEKLIALKSNLSSANVSQLVVRHPALLQHPPHQLEQMVLEAEAALSSQLSSEETALLLETEPWLLEPGALTGCIGGLSELFPSKDPCRLLLQHVVVGGSKLLQDYKHQALAQGLTGKPGSCAAQ